MAPTVRKFTAQGSDLLHAAKWVEKATSKDSTLFAVKVEGGVLSLEAYNGIHSSIAKVTVDQKFPDETHFSVNSRMFSDALKNIGNNTVELTFSERKLLMVAPRMRYTLPVTVPRSTTDLPTMPEKFGVVESKHFTTLLAHAASMASDDPSTPSLTTVHFKVEPQNKFFKMMSTDRYRMVIRKVHYVPDADASQENFEFDVDSAALKTLVAGLGEVDNISLYAEKDGSNIFGVGTNMARASVLLKDVKPINYAAFESQTTEHGIVMDRKILANAISKTKGSMSGTAKLATLIINGNEATLVAESDDIDTEMEIDVTSQNYDEEFRIRLNLDFVGAILKAGSSKYVKFGADKPAKPVLVYEMKDEDTKEDEYFSLFMPMSV